MQSTTPDAPFLSASTKHKRTSWCRLLLALVSLLVGTTLALGLMLYYVVIIAGRNLPPLNALTDYHPKVPLRIYTKDHVLIGEFGKEHRNIVQLTEVTETMKKAVLAIEDYRFYDHSGVDLTGILRAGMTNFTRGSNAQGASTITMQVARNFFLSSEKTYTRKLYEILLAYKIESALTKNKILEVYMNHIYLGQRAYGFASAARIYFGKDLKNLTLAQEAMLAGLPKAPSAYNPIVNPRRAKIRQEYILQRMLKLHYINTDQYNSAIHEPIALKTVGTSCSVHAEYVAEIVRQLIYSQYRDETYTRGFNVITTIHSSDQEAAYHAVHKGVIDYDRRHGYRGPEGFVKLPSNSVERERAIDDVLLEHPDNGDLIAAVVTKASLHEVRASLINGNTVIIQGEGLRFAAASLSGQANQKQRIHPGSIIRITKDAHGFFSIIQLPQVESALISLTPQDGAIRSLIGGFDFNQSKFNHVTQAWRQPGSSFKPFIYSAALDKGLGPSTIISDAPLYFASSTPGGPAWEPKNYGGNYSGPMTMRTALQKSQNLVSIRILGYIGINYAKQYIMCFGFDEDKHPAYLPMALGAGIVTPLQMAAGYAVFANGGYYVNPHLISEVTDARGQLIAQARPVVAEKNAPRVIDARNAYIMNNMLIDVAQNGTGSKSNVLQRVDIGGKTGTTNESRDAWFAGYQHTLVAVVWIGFDSSHSLGPRETGGKLALPIWIDYMGQALKNKPTYTMPIPPGIKEIDSELYYDSMLPGAGFIETVGMSSSVKIGELTSDTPDLGINTSVDTFDRVLINPNDSTS
ncbi:penicillin-binding protein 1A [Candidatus Vallotia lariciata]|uniref:penicillin-binding protein 1A n=1 Tax=Candidatus Vallotia laricis TaxID=2018052 RepID=UPI001D00EE1D|nr:penicillin-binding protein 1A [Candidatus Vallotia lariciata]UDG82756.1 Penicillin-binding protein 1A [Candidatus Vallotia lariciata]